MQFCTEAAVGMKLKYSELWVSKLMKQIKKKSGEALQSIW